MTYNVMIENKPTTGTAEEILYTLKDKSFFNRCNTINEFIRKVQQDIWRLYGIGIHINDDKTAPDQLIRQLLHFNLLRPVSKESFK